MYERVLCFRLVFSQIERRASSLAPRPRVGHSVSHRLFTAALARLTNPFGAWDLARAQFRARPPHAGALLTRQRRTSTIPASASRIDPRATARSDARASTFPVPVSRKRLARLGHPGGVVFARARVLFPRAPARRGDRPAAAERAPTCGFHPRNRPSSLNVPRARIEDEHPRA